MNRSGPLQRGTVAEDDERKAHLADLASRAHETQEGIALDIDPLMRHAVTRQELSGLLDTRRRSVAKQIDGEGSCHCICEPTETFSVAAISCDSQPELHEGR